MVDKEQRQDQRWLPFCLFRSVIIDSNVNLPSQSRRCTHQSDHSVYPPSTGCFQNIGNSTVTINQSQLSSQGFLRSIRRETNEKPLSMKSSGRSLSQVHFNCRAGANLIPIISTINQQFTQPFNLTNPIPLF